MSESPIQFTNAWLGYDVPYQKIESQPVVQVVRKQGVQSDEKEHSVHIASFREIDLDTINTFLHTSEKEYGKPLGTSQITFDHYGSLESGGGHYVYLSPSEDSAKELLFLKKRVGNVEGVSADSTTKHPHLSVGGKDPFEHDKAPQANLPQPFTVEGRLIFVGKVGDHFHRYFWNEEKGQFLSEDYEEPKEALPIHTIAIFPKVQVDTIVAIFLLKEFGEEFFPGIREAKIEFRAKAPQDKTPEETEKEGTLLVDLGGMFDHHRANKESGKRQDCAATLIAKYLKVDDKKYLKKLLEWARRDDLEGKGTVSEDSIDRAFGLSGVISNLNRELKETPERIVELILPLIEHHVAEQRHRAEGLPKLYDDLEANGKIIRWKMKQGSAELKAVAVECDDIAMAGWLKAVKRMDFIVQRAPTGHTNMITRQERSIDLRPVIAKLRVEEAMARGDEISLNKDVLESPGALEQVPMWYYDDAANTLQNGGIDPGDIPATTLSLERIIEIVKETIPNGVIGSLKRRKAKELKT